MNRKLADLAAFFVAFAPALGHAQIIQQNKIVPGHASRWVAPGLLGDGGGIAGGKAGAFLTELGTTNPGIGYCQNSGPITAPYLSFCSGFLPSGDAVLALDGHGESAPGRIILRINGSSFELPGAGNGDMLAPTPNADAGHVVLWNGGTTTADGGSPYTINVMDARFGAKCDGSASDSAAFNAAGAYLGAKGGNIFVPATGAACVLATGISLPRNVALVGVGVNNWTATNDTVAATSAAGSWLKCADLSNACVTIANVGSAIRGVNFVYAQPDPAPGWTPTIYPYTIAVTGSQNFTALENITITGATHCILLEGPDSGVANIYTRLSNINFNGCFNVGTRFYRVDNTLFMSNLRYAPYWNLANAHYSDVQAYYRAHAVGWDVQYLANAQATGIEFWQNYRAIQARNGTVNSGFGAITFAANELQLSNVSFNEVCQAISLPDGNGTWFTAVANNIIAYGDTSSNCYSGKPMFDLASDAASLTIYGLHGGFMDKVANVGHGAGGKLHIIDGDVQQYAAVTPGTNAFGVSANSTFVLAPTPYRNIRAAAGAGALIGPGVDATQGYEEPLEIGGCGTVGTPGQGCVLVKGSLDTSHSGSTEYLLPDGTRVGFVGRGSTAREFNFVADAGDVNMIPGTNKVVNLIGPVKTGIYTVATLPACDATRQSSRVTISDQMAAPVYGAAPTGGGGFSVSVTCTNGTGWLLQ